jgi:hypothetical protein
MSALFLIHQSYSWLLTADQLKPVVVVSVRNQSSDKVSFVPAIGIDAISF